MLRRSPLIVSGTLTWLAEKPTAFGKWTLVQLDLFVWQFVLKRADQLSVLVSLLCADSFLIDSFATHALEIQYGASLSDQCTWQFTGRSIVKSTAVPTALGCKVFAAVVYDPGRQSRSTLFGCTEEVTVEMMHKTPSFWRRAKMPWVFGHAKQIQNQHPSLCAPWSVHVFLRHGGPPPRALHQSGLTTGKAFMASRSSPKTASVVHKFPHPGC